MDISIKKAQTRLAHLTELESLFTFRISRMSKLLDAQASRMLFGFGINLTNYRILLVTGIFKEISAADLSRIMAFDRAQISRAAIELRKLDMLEEHADPTSKRRQLLRLTEAGKKVIDQASSIAMVRQRTLEELLTEQELAVFNSAVGKISNYLVEELAHPQAISALLSDGEKPLAYTG